MLTTTIVANKITPGTVRFAEPDVPESERPLSIYLPNETLEGLGVKDIEIGVTAIKLTLESA